MYSNRGAHIHEMYSKPLIRKGLRLVGYTEVIETLVGEGFSRFSCRIRLLNRKWSNYYDLQYDRYYP